MQHEIDLFADDKGGHNKEQRDSELEYDETFPPTAAGVGRRRVGPPENNRGQIPGQNKGGIESRTEGDDNREHQAKTEDMNAKKLKKHSLRDIVTEPMKGRVDQQQPGDHGDERQKETLREKLTNERGPAAAQHFPDPDLFCPAKRLGGGKVNEVDGGDQ